MLTINLLPQQLRPVEHTPYPRLIAILAGVVVVLVMGFMDFNLHNNINKEIGQGTQLDDENAALQRQIDESGYAQNLQQLAILRSREQILLALNNARFLWAPKLNYLYKHSAYKEPGLDPDCLFPPEIQVYTMSFSGRATRVKNPVGASQPPVIQLEMGILNDGDIPPEKILDNFKEKIRSLGKDKDGKVTAWPAPTAETAASEKWDFIDPASADTFDRIQKGVGKYDRVGGKLIFKPIK